MIDAGTKKRRNPPRSPADQLVAHVLDQRQATDSRTHNDTNSRSELVIQRIPRGQPGIGHRLGCRSHTEVDEGVHGAGIFGVDVGSKIEIFDLARNLAGEGGSIKLRDEIDTGLTGKQIGPGLRHRVAHGAHTTQACHDDTAASHAVISLWDGPSRSRWRFARW